MAADAVTTQILHENKSNLTVKFTNVSGGDGESAVTKVDVSALTPTSSAAEVDILGIWYSTDGMAVQILWDADADVVAWLLPTNQSDYLDFTTVPPGCIRNNASTGKTGDIKFTTVGHTAGDTYSIILYLKKRLTAEV